MIKSLSLLFLLISSTAYSAPNGDDLIKTWRGKQEAYFKGEALVHSNSLEAATKLEGLLNNYTWSAKERVTMLHKLAEIHLSIGRVNENNNPRIVLDSHSKKALDIFNTLINKHSNYEKFENVLFTYGFELFMRNNYKKAYLILTELNKRFPKSEFTEDALALRADSKFEMSSFRAAEKLYKKSYMSSDEELKLYSLYKMAWSQFNAHKYNEAYKSLSTLLTTKTRVKNTMDEALTDIALFYHKQRLSFNPYKDLSKIVPKSKLEGTLSTLGKLSMDVGHWKSSLIVYSELIQNFTTSESLSIYHLKKGISLSTTKNIRLSGVEIAKGLELCKNDACATLANDDIFELVNNWEKHWRKHKKNAHYLDALRAVYPKLADVAKKDSEKSKIYLLLAEVELYSKNYFLASAAYEKAFRLNPKASYANEALWQSIYVLQNVDNKGWNKDRVLNLERLVSYYIEHYSSHPKAIQAQSILAKAYIDSKLTERASGFYKELSHKFIYTKAGTEAYNNFLKVNIQEKNYESILAYLMEYKKFDKKKKIHSLINKDFDSAVEEWTTLLLKETNYDKAGKVFALALKERPHSKFAESWSWNLALSYSKENKHSQAAKYFLAYEKKYKNKDKKQILSLENAFSSFVASRNPKDALGISKKLTAIDTKNKEKWIMTSAQILTDLNKHIDAIKTLSLLSKEHPQKNPLFLENIKTLNKKEVKSVLDMNLNGFTNESIAELVVKLIHEINDIKSVETQIAARSLTKIKTPNKNYFAIGSYYLGLYELQKLEKERYKINSSTLNKILKPILKVDTHLRNSVANAQDSTQVKALIALTKLYMQVPIKYYEHTKNLYMSKKDVSPFVQIVNPFFDQAREFVKESKSSIKLVKDKKEKSRLSHQIKLSEVYVEKHARAYERYSNQNLISKRGL